MTAILAAASTVIPPPQNFPCKCAAGYESETEMIKQVKQRRGLSIAFFAVILIPSAAFAQYQYPQGTPQTFEEYTDYPQIRGKTQLLTEHELPSWMTLDGELRSRTEDQSAINLLPGQ